MRPVRMRSSTSVLAQLTGIAKPMFCAPKMIAVLIPMTSPLRFTSGPPELPWLMATSVWMTWRRFSICPPVPSAAEILRPSPETMPLDTVLLKSPSALPMAITVWPSSILLESPRATVGSPVAWIFSIATSLIGSRESTLAGYSFSSLVMTVYSASGS